MTSKTVLLQRAQDQFLNKDYINALRIYGLLLKDYPLSKDARVGAYLSDMGLDLDDDAQALFDYYLTIRGSIDDAEEIINELSKTIYSTRIIIQDQIDNITEEQPELQNGISYDDFVALIDNKGNFREAFENIMFSTKVIITTKSDFIDFVNRLITAKYYDIALKYLDSIGDNFYGSQDVYSLYNLINREKNEN